MGQGSPNLGSQEANAATLGAATPLFCPMISCLLYRVVFLKRRQRPRALIATSVYYVSPVPLFTESLVPLSVRGQLYLIGTASRG